MLMCARIIPKTSGKIWKKNQNNRPELALSRAKSAPDEGSLSA